MQLLFAGKVAETSTHKFLAVVTLIPLTFCAVVLSPVLVLLHFVLRGFGRNGFYFNDEIRIDAKSFDLYKPKSPFRYLPY